MSEETISAPHDDEIPEAEPGRTTPEQYEAEQRANPHFMAHQPAFTGIPPTAWADRLGYAQQTGEGDPIGYPVEAPVWAHNALNEAERLAAMPGSDVRGVLGHNIRRWGLISETKFVRVYFTICEECGAMGIVVAMSPWVPRVEDGDYAHPEFHGPLFQRRCQWEGT